MSDNNEYEYKPVYAYKSVSMYDILQDKDLKQAVLDNNEDVIHKVLWTVGLDVHHEEFEMISCEHRPRSLKINQTWNGPLFIAPERVDKQYLESGLASDTVKLEAKGDISLIAELNRIGRQSNFTGELLNNARRHKRVIEKEWKGEL